MDQFHSFGANPETLSEEQKKLTPILLLNGNYSHQGTFLPLLHALQQANNKRPVYTINLPPNTRDPAFIESKIKAIKGQYGLAEAQALEIDMVGHSMGSSLIQGICSQVILVDVRLRRVITVGRPFFSYGIAMAAKYAFDIVGKKDCLALDKSVLPKKNHKNINTGHLGLLFHQDSLNAMVKCLVSKKIGSREEEASLNRF
jgi:hypothetical protein